ncbi:hypothetical protein IAU60_002305 [Kwoniella sp. DSM 27419]
MVKTRTLNFLAPSLHPNTLVDLAFPEPKLGLVPTADEPIVQHLPIKYGEHQPLGSGKRMARTADNEVVIADDKFQVSRLSLSSVDTDEPPPPVVVAQHTVKARSKDVWAGLVPVQGGVVSALTSGLLTYHSPSSTEASGSRTVPSPLLCLASSTAAPTSFAMGGKEVDVSVWDVERTFASSANDKVEKNWESGKRKKNVLENGQTWQAKNVPQNNLSLRQPIHHLSLTYLPDSPNLLVSGTKAGTVRRFDTRQRKPLSDWKVAKEGGIGCVVPGVEHELFFSDRSNLLGSLDLRTGKILYTYSSLTATPFHLLSIPPPSSLDTPEPATRRAGLASVSSDATFRLHTSTTPPEEGTKGNWGAQGKKGEVLRMVGGVGVSECIWRGYSEREIVVAKPEKEVKPGQDDEEGDEAEEELGDEEVWEKMDEVADEGKAEDSDDYSDSDSDEGEQDRVIVKAKPKKKTKRAL